ncbi:TonB-dependent siderophore receptor [Pandoraea sp. PE-S2T-3]|uniref:TonB-dependent siderophore receptor n=1 Tax=Pandoraea sp. PE-S2T-3 TaxID=1986993 RepID=UPI000B3F9B59|nr:TonB-dependent siderophore receptor [Pandoraea sp. PE-S2T-3]
MTNTHDNVARQPSRNLKSAKHRTGVPGWLRRRGSGLIWAPLLAPLGAPLAFAALSGTAHAQDSGVPSAVALPTQEVRADREESPTGRTDGVVAKRSVSATKTDTPLVRVPQSVSVVTRDQMDAQGATTIDQALRYTPGVSSQDATDFRFDQLRGRGFSYDTYLDGLILQPNAFYANPRIDPYFLERIEVLRGPASVLYGAGSPAGIVNLITKMPSDEPVHELMLQVGSHSRFEAGFDMGGKLTDDGTILYRVTGLARDANSQVNGIKDQRLAIAPSVTIRASRDTSLTLFASYQRDPAGGLFNSLPVSGVVSGNPNGKIDPNTYVGNPDVDYFRRTQYSFGAKFEHAFNDTLKFRSNLRYLHDDIDYHQSFFLNYLSGSTSTVSMNAFLDREHLSQFAWDNQIEGKLSTGPLQHTVLVGLDYQRLLSGTSSGTGPIGTLNVFAPNYSTLGRITTTNKRVDTATNQFGMYAQDQIQYGGWTALLGLRQDWTSMNVQTQTTTSASIQNQSPHAFTWRGGLSYLFDSGIAPYFSYAKSFQPTAGVDYFNQALKPTTGEQYEIGVKYQPKSYNALYTVSFYNLTQQNVTTADPAHNGSVIQTGEVRSRGIELEARLQLTDSLSAIGSYTYLNQTVMKTNTASQLGKRPTMMPRYLSSLWLDYTLHGGVLRGLGFGAGVRVIGPSAGDVQNTFDVPAVALFDAAIHYDTGNWSFAVNGSNLFNRKYAAYCSGGACYYGSTASVIGTAKYRW